MITSIDNYHMSIQNKNIVYRSRSLKYYTCSNLVLIVHMNINILIKILGFASNI